jgi:four helix bundle protein
LLSRAGGSLYDLETQAELAESLGFLTQAALDELLTDCAEVGRMLHGLANSMKEER